MLLSHTTIQELKELNSSLRVEAEGLRVKSEDIQKSLEDVKRQNEELKKELEGKHLDIALLVASIHISRNAC